MYAETTAGSIPRTTRDASLPQESTENTVCDECGVREADGMNPDGRALCRACARRARTLVCDGSGVSEDKLESRKETLKEAIKEISDADPDSLTLYPAGHGHFLIHSDESEQDIDEIDAALDGTGYERDGIINPPGMTQQNVAPVEDGDSDD